MLEIILIIFLCSRMGKHLRAKGRKPVLMQVMVVVVWIVSMFTGAMAYSIYVAITRGMEAVEDIGMFSAYPSALLAGVVGQLLLFGIAWLVPVRQLATEVPVTPDLVTDGQPYRPIG